MTDYNPYQPDQQYPAPAEPVYPPSAPQYAVQPYVTQPYPAYGPQPMYGAAYQPLITSGMAVAGMVVGIIALVTFWIPFVDLLLGFLAIGLSWGGMVQSDRPGHTGKGMAIAGLVCGIIAVIPALIVMLFFFGLFAAAGTACGIAC
ncbi:protein of unknown function [Amycolatopsis pretoriensis]|uniref:DUF4190 domain-containing protein n=1 Tax=Amycolatopsis pretoriensis TaxID=218821 RepID=A0A1H5REM7_9PSEU|nr:DUF4190 domain-containing protein [Amycolatopsis pretoriensis]SEF36775.1 protein of unknown function [Amycolatopsis pretoriensis]